MSRLIDADAFLEDLENLYCSPCREAKKDRRGTACYACGVCNMVDAIEDAPTVDAVEVVRCKDCIYTRKLYGRLVCKYGTCSGCILCEDFFCATGVKREGSKP